MGLTNVLQIGRMGISASQAAIQVAGNNMSNAATPGYSRQTALLSPVRGQQIGPYAFAGGGVQLSAIQRQIDEAVLGRLRNAYADEHSAMVGQQMLTQIESLQNELSDTDISTGLTEFFASWNDLANNPDDSAIRALVVQRGTILSEQLRDLRQNYTEIQTQIDRDLGTHVSKANDLITQIADINLQISQSEGGRGPNSALRDERDRLLDELSKFMDISTNEQPSGAVDVFVGSIPVVLGSEARGVKLDIKATPTGSTVTVRVQDDGSKLDVESGRIGALLKSRDGAAADAIEDIDELAGALIYNVNRVHSQGQGKVGFTSVTGSYVVGDSTAALNSADAELPFDIRNGSFMLHLTDQSTGTRTSHQIDVDLDGIGTDTSLDSLVSDINTALGGSGATATVTPDGRLKLEADDGTEITFSDDTAGVLAGLGVNTYFTGQDASDINVNEALLNSNQLLAVGSDHIEGSNGTALAIAGLDTKALDEFDGLSLSEFWSKNVEDLAVRTNGAATRMESTRVIRENLEAERATVSGVSLDEEAVNLMTFQQQYQASAQLIATAEELTQVLLSIL